MKSFSIRNPCTHSTLPCFSSILQSTVQGILIINEYKVTVYDLWLKVVQFTIISCHYYYNCIMLQYGTFWNCSTSTQLYFRVEFQTTKKNIIYEFVQYFTVFPPTKVVVNSYLRLRSYFKLFPTKSQAPNWLTQQVN